MRTILFDMDGLLIDSEPLWYEAEVYGFGLAGLCLSPEQCLETTGLRVDEVVRFRHAQQPWTSPDQEDDREAICGSLGHASRVEAARPVLPSRFPCQVV